MQKTARIVGKFVIGAACLLGGFGSFMQWAGIKPKDLAMSQSIAIPHVLWLLLAIALFAIGIGSSVWSGIVQHREISRLKSIPPTPAPIAPTKLTIRSAEFKAINEEGEVRDVTEAVKGQVNGSGLAFKIINSELGMREGDDLNFGERKRLTVKYSFDGGPEVTVRRWERDRLILPLDPQLQGLNDLQVKAILIATAALAMLAEIGTKPVPKYTEVEINTMPEVQRLALLRSKDKDYTEACDYHFGGPNVVVGEREVGFEDRAATKATTRYSFHRPWEAKVKARYEARFGEDLGHLRKALSGSDLASRFPVTDLQEWDVETQIKKISKELWTLAFDLGEMNENS